MKLKIIFLGTGPFANIILKELRRTGYKPIYRSLDDIEKINPDLVIVANFGKIISEKLLKIPKYGCLNLHPSLLPKYRGASPLQTAILNGDKETGTSIILMDEKIDHGPILAQKKTDIFPSETTEKLCNRLALLSSELLINVVPGWVKGEKKPVPQNEKKASYTKILNRKDGEIDWKKSPKEIERKIRALQPWPGTHTFYKGKRIKVLKSRLEKGKLIIEEVQPEGKKPMRFKDFLLGHKDFKIP